MRKRRGRRKREVEEKRKEENYDIKSKKDWKMQFVLHKFKCVKKETTEIALLKRKKAHGN